MPIASYFKGHGEDVMRSMTKSNHGNKEAAAREFYATANKMKMKPTSKMPKGATQSPKGDLGERRQMEALRAGGFTKGARTICPAKEFNGGR